MTPNERDELLKYIFTASFAVDESVLYLDTHPTDKVALQYYHKYNAIRQQALKEYNTYFGPLSDESVESTTKWTWVEDPWPWETGR